MGNKKKKNFEYLIKSRVYKKTNKLKKIKLK